MRLKIHVLISSLVYSMFLGQLDSLQQNVIKIGLIVDMGSSMGKVVQSCVDMAISDANALHRQNGTWIVLHPKDSKGEPFTAITAAKDLLKSIKLDAIIVPEMTSEASLMATLGDKANVPILSFTSIPLSTAHPYFLQITEEENTQFQGIIALLDTFKWRNIILIHEDTDDGRNILPHILEEFQDRNIHVIYKNAISLSEKGIEELEKLKMMHTSVFVVHTSPSLASKIFINSKKLDMMSEGYAWLITSKTMNFLDSLDPLVKESMQGALGLKSYIQASRKLQNFSLRWRNEVQHVKSNQEQTDFNILGIKAYDTIWALVKATARLRSKRKLTYVADIRLSNHSSDLLSEILKSEFTVLGGDFRFMNGKLVVKGYKVVNVIGKEKREVGFWTLANGFTKEISFVNEMHGRGLQTIIWPGLSINIPEGRWLYQASGKVLRIGVPMKVGFQELIRVQSGNQSIATRVTGFCLDVFVAAIENLEYDVPYEFIPFKQDEGSSNDLIYMVYTKVFDAAIGDITITSNRSLYVDFTLPYTDLGLGTVVALQGQTKWFFLKPLDMDLWITVACFFVLLGVIVWLLEHPINEEFQGSRAQQITTILWFSVSTLVYAHRERLRSNLSKFVVGVWLFVVFILASSYTAILSSILTVQQIQLAKGDYIGYQAGSTVRGAVVNNLNFADDRLKPYLSMEEYNDALSTGSKHGGIGAIIDEMPYIKMFLAKYPSDHVLADQTSSTTGGFGFAFQKGSPLAPDISRAIVKLRENGRLLELDNKWYNQRKSESNLLSNDYEQTQPKTLSLDNFLGLFFVTCLSKIIALLIFLIFFLHKKLSLNHHIIRILVKGKLAFIMKYVSPRMANAIGGNGPR